jgi:OOP family OmpA-OmpF porin
MGKHLTCMLLALCLALLSAPAAFSAAPPDHPVIKPLPEVIEKRGEFKRFEAHKFRVSTGDKYEEKEVRGKYWYFTYWTKPEISRLEILENYKQAALEKNGQIIYEGKDELMFTLGTPEGGILWVHLQAQDAKYWLYIVEEKPLKKTLTFGAAQIKSELETKGEVTLYGVNFDFNKATLRPESEQVLLEAVKVLQSLPDIKVEVQGHTCDIGGRAYNLKLSQARAETVKNFLVQHGIEESRLSPRGYGMDIPVASNATEEGRAQNRRVVFKKL